MKFQVAFLGCILFAFAPHAGAGHFLFFASPKKRKQKKGDCGHRFGFAKLPSLHAVFRAGSQLAAAPLRTCKPLFPEKPCSVRLRQQRGHSCRCARSMFCVRFLESYFNGLRLPETRNYQLQPAFSTRWRRVSASTMPVLTDTLRLSTVPSMGMETNASQCSRVRRRMPSPSLPITQATAAGMS